MWPEYLIAEKIITHFSVQIFASCDTIIYLLEVNTPFKIRNTYIEQIYIYKQLYILTIFRIIRKLTVSNDFF